MDKVQISIIIPVYNAEEWLDRCLNSILIQNYSSCEVILVNDGSTDSSPMICEKYSSMDPRFRTIHQKNMGVSEARNAGLNVADGRYIMFADSDDALSPGALDAMSEGTESDPDFVTGGFNIYNGGLFYADICPRTDGFYGQDSMDMFWNDTMSREGELFRGPWAKLYRRSIIKRYSLRFNAKLSYAEDKLFLYDFLKHASSAYSVSVPVYDYYRHEGSLSGGKTTERRAAQLLDVLPLCAASFVDLTVRFPDNQALRRVFHNDIICCDLMRVLRHFIKKPTILLTESNLRILYDIMDKDSMMRLLERRIPGQILNVFLYRIGNVSFTRSVYRMTSSILRFFYD